jgi:hypothetical protein
MTFIGREKGKSDDPQQLGRIKNLFCPRSSATRQEEDSGKNEGVRVVLINANWKNGRNEMTDASRSLSLMTPVFYTSLFMGMMI